MFKLPVITAAMLVAIVPAHAQAEKANNRPIIVYGQSLDETERALQACIERGCPSDEDIAATLAHAENQFVDGVYKDARTTLLASLKRNRQHKDRYPVPVSDLLRANGNVAIHLGEAGSYRSSVLDMRDVLRDALPATDYRVLGAQLEVADSRMRLGYPDEALAKYREIAADARRVNLPVVAAMAELRHLSLLSQIAQLTKEARRYREAEEAIAKFIANPESGAEQYTIAAEILSIRLQRAQGQDVSADALVQRLAAAGGTSRPTLIYAQPIERDETEAQRNAAFGNTLNRMQMNAVDKVWVDLGFWINELGRVEDIEILRSAGSTEWTDRVIESIESRIYAPPSTASDAAPGFYAVERYTLTADWTDVVTGTRLRERLPVTRIERLDLTVTDPGVGEG